MATSAAGSTIGGQGVCVPVHLGLSWEIYAVYIYNYIIFTDRNHICIYICMYVIIYIYRNLDSPAYFGWSNLPFGQ